MRGTAKLSKDINEPWTIKQHQAHTSYLFADDYNDVGENIFTVTDKLILSTADDTYTSKLQRQYTWDWEKEYDKGIAYDFSELMDFTLNSKGEVIADLSDTYLNRADAEIPAMKYAYFFGKDGELRLTVPNQADDGLSLAYINEAGQLIIDNNEV